MTRPNENAFPLKFSEGLEFGLTKREYIATHITAAMLANKNVDHFTTKRELVTYALEVTEQLIHQINLEYGKD